MSFYVVVDIGCLECHQATDVLGIFRQESDAILACAKYVKDTNRTFSTDQDLKIFEVESLNKLFPPRWKGYDTYYDLGQDDGYKYQLRPK